MLTLRLGVRNHRLARLLLAGGIVVATALTGRPAPAQDSLFFIGDSLTDYGNLYDATRALNAENSQVPILPPPSRYFAGRYSNGPTYAERLSSILGVSDSKVVSFAFGGAESGSCPSAACLFEAVGIDPGVLGIDPAALEGLNIGALDQVGGAIMTPGVVGPNGLAVYQVGANDYLNNVRGLAAGDLTPRDLVGRVVGNINDGIDGLAQAGQQKFAVLNLSDMGETPRGRELDPTVASSLSQLSAAHNTELLTVVTELESEHGLDITLVAMDDLFDDMLTNPSRYGFTKDCFYTPVSSPEVRDCSTPENEGPFYDGVHPTARAHQITAEYIAAYIDMKANAGADIAARSMLGLLSSRSQQRLMEARLLSLRSGYGTGNEVEVGKVAASLSGNFGIGDLKAAVPWWPSATSFTGDFGIGDRDGDADQRGFDYDVTTAMLGLDWRVTQSALFGAGFGYSEADLELDDGRGRADLESWFGTVYGTLGNRTAYMDAAAGYSADDYHFSRPTGFSPRPTALANPEGSTWFALLSGGYNFTHGSTSFGPIIGGRWTQSQINGYEENAGPLALSVRTSTHESWVGFIGGQVSSLFQIGDLWVAPHLRVTGENDFGDEEKVRARLGSGQTISGEVADNEPAVVFGGGLEFGIGEHLAAQVSGETTLTREGGTDAGIQGRLIGRF